MIKKRIVQDLSIKLQSHKSADSAACKINTIPPNMLQTDPGVVNVKTALLGSGLTSAATEGNQEIHDG